MSTYDCTLGEIELTNFPWRRDVNSGEVQYDEHRFERALQALPLVGNRDSYMVITRPDKFANDNRFVPDHIHYFEQVIVDTKRGCEVSLEKLCGVEHNLLERIRRFSLKFSSPSKHIVDNIPAGYVGPSHLHGYGLFACEAIVRGEVIGTLDGQVIPRGKHQEIRRANRFYGFDEWTAISETELLARPFRTKYGYINHSRLPNIELKGRDLVVIRPVAKDEEILIDYRKEFLGAEYVSTKGRYL